MYIVLVYILWGDSALRPFSSGCGGIYKQQEGDAYSAEALKPSLGRLVRPKVIMGPCGL